VFINSNYTGANIAANDLTIGKTTTGNHGITIATGTTYEGSIYFGDSDNNDAGIIGYQHSTNSMKFTTNRSEKYAHHLIAGNVGIGTTGIGVNDRLIIKTSVDNDVAQGLVVQRSINTDEGYINYNGGGFQFRATDGDPIILGQLSNERVRIDSTGNVGIGTTPPTSRLQVKGSGTTNATTAFRVENANASGSMVVLDDGNVGIGTTAPTEKLSVVGKIDLNDGGSSVFIGTGAGLNDDASDNRNVGVGYQALYSNTTGADNTANGVYSLYANTTGVNNTANGFYSLYSNTTGNNNTANGYASLNSNTTGGQ
jgi:hypothetical protein